MLDVDFLSYVSNEVFRCVLRTVSLINKWQGAYNERVLLVNVCEFKRVARVANLDGYYIRTRTVMGISTPSAGRNEASKSKRTEGEAVEEKVCTALRMNTTKACRSLSPLLML